MTRPLAGAVLVLAAAGTVIAAQDRPAGQGFSFRSAVSLINVTVTVTDANGHFVGGLREGDFEVFEDGAPQAVASFDAARVPVSLGIAVDTSGSMIGDRWVAAKAALGRFANELLGEQDEVFLYRFDSQPQQLHGWTADRGRVGRALESVTPRGGTAMYDAVADALPLAQQGSRKKKALVIISDGNDTSSTTRVPELSQQIRESEVLVYAIGIDASGIRSASSSSSSTTARPPSPSPFPGRKPPASPVPSAPARPSGSSGSSGGSDRVNVDALRSITDDSGGRTEIVFGLQDLEPATAGIAGELSRQYFLTYHSSAPKDGRWHTIEVRIKKGNGAYRVRARRGFIAS